MRTSVSACCWAVSLERVLPLTYGAFSAMKLSNAWRTEEEVTASVTNAAQRRKSPCSANRLLRNCGGATQRASSSRKRRRPRPASSPGGDRG